MHTGDERWCLIVSPTLILTEQCYSLPHLLIEGGQQLVMILQDFVMGWGQAEFVVQVSLDTLWGPVCEMRSEIHETHGKKLHLFHESVIYLVLLLDQASWQESWQWNILSKGDNAGFFRDKKYVVPFQWKQTSSNDWDHVYETICSSLTQPGTDGGVSPSLSSYSVLIRLF